MRTNPDQKSFARASGCYFQQAANSQSRRTLPVPLTWRLAKYARFSAPPKNGEGAGNKAFRSVWKAAQLTWLAASRRGIFWMAWAVAADETSCVEKSA